MVKAVTERTSWKAFVSVIVPARWARAWIERHIAVLLAFIDIIAKVSTKDVSATLSNLRKSLSNESIVDAFREHYEVVRILNHGVAHALSTRYPHYVHKYIHDYLAKGLSKKTRRDILKYHHQFLADHVRKDFYEQILERRPVLWSDVIDKDRYVIVMTFSQHGHAEGDLSLSFERNGVSLYTVSFTVVAGSLIDCAAENVVLVACVQGTPNEAAAIGIATRACHRISPAHVLMAGVQGIALGLEIHTICGVTNRAQLVKTQRDCIFDYDAFWETLAFKCKGRLAYEISVPCSEKQPVHAGYRGKVRVARRRFKSQIAESVRATFTKEFVIKGDSAITPSLIELRSSVREKVCR